MPSSLPLHAAAFQNAREQREPVDLRIQGTIPLWLSGSLYRTGPGTYTIPTDKNKNGVVAIQHWFDGLTMNHKFEIHPRGERVSYSSRKATDDYEESVVEKGKLPSVSFGQKDICQTVFKKFFTTFDQGLGMSLPTPSSQNVGVTITPDMPGWDGIIDGLPKESKERLGARPRYLVAKTDANMLQLLDPTSLEPLAITTYKSLDSRLDGELSAAHSCIDTESGDFYNYTLNLWPSTIYKVFRVSKSKGKVDVLCEIKDAPASYIHSFAMTEKYVVLIVWQAHIKRYGLPILYHKNITQAIEQKWDPSLNSLFYVVDKRKGGVVAKYKAPPFFCFHQLNSFDDPTKDDIILDLSVYDDHSVIDRLYLDNILNADPTQAKAVPIMGRARRFRLTSVTSGKAREWRSAQAEFTLPYSEAIELPTINPGKYHRPYRYAYGINKRSERNTTFADAVIKLDMESRDGGHKIWEDPGYTPSEPIFVPRPDGDGEDDGVVLSVLLDGNGEKARSMLVILDAKEMKELARAEMETVYPIGFHGVFTPI